MLSFPLFFSGIFFCSLALCSHWKWYDNMNKKIITFLRIASAFLFSSSSHSLACLISPYLVFTYFSTATAQSEQTEISFLLVYAGICLIRRDKVHENCFPFCFGWLSIRYSIHGWFVCFPFSRWTHHSFSCRRMDFVKIETTILFIHLCFNHIFFRFVPCRYGRHFICTEDVIVSPFYEY